MPTESAGQNPDRKAAEQPLEILHRDASLVVINKPSGLLVHRSYLASDRVTCQTILRDQIGQYVYPAHRLDRQTSGVLIFTTSRESLAAVNAMLAERGATKRYLAIVRGWPPESGTIERPLKRDNGEPLTALTTYRTVAHAELPYPTRTFASTRVALIAAEPKTGRFHQIRRHLAGIDHPVLGDSVHGDTRQNRAFNSYIGEGRLWLHAWHWASPHPDESGTDLAITAPFPPLFTQVVERCGWVIPSDATDPSMEPCPQ